MLIAQIAEDRRDVMMLFDEHGRFHSRVQTNDNIEAIQAAGDKIYVTTNGRCRKLAIYEVTTLNQCQFVTDRLL